jgi:DNA-binding NarL/FixJ family response regulator
MAGGFMGTISIVIADDHELVRYALETVIDAEDDMDVVAQACDGAEAVERVTELEPDLLLLDLHMPEMDGVEVCQAVRVDVPDTKVLILTSFDDDDEVFGALSAGAHGYIMKDVAPRSLLETIRGVAEGRTVLDAAVAQRILEGREEKGSSGGAEGLSPRELEVLGLMAEGLTNREIAEKLWISEATVKTHVSHILAKLGQSDRTKAVLVAIKRGLVRLEDDSA